VGQQALYLAALLFYMCSLSVVLAGRRIRATRVAAPAYTPAP